MHEDSHKWNTDFLYRLAVKSLKYFIERLTRNFQYCWTFDGIIVMHSNGLSFDGIRLSLYSIDSYNLYTTDRKIIEKDYD